MVGRCIPYWNSPFLVDMLVLGGVSLWFFFRVVLLFHTTTRDTNVQIQIDNECLQFLSHVFQIKSFRPLTPDFTQTIWSFNLFAISHLPPPKKKSSAHKQKEPTQLDPPKTQVVFFGFKVFICFVNDLFSPVSPTCQVAVQNSNLIQLPGCCCCCYVQGQGLSTLHGIQWEWYWWSSTYRFILGRPWNAYALCLDDALEIGKGWVQAAVKGA